MKATTQTIGKKVRTLILKYLKKKEDEQVFMELAENLYNIPRSITSDIIAFRTNAANESENVLFAILDVFIHIYGDNSADLSQYFDHIEIASYSKWKYEREVITFPLRFKVFATKDRHWTGVISTEELIRLRRMSVTAYDPNIQRRTTSRNRGGKIVQEITINPESVREIEESMEAGTYTPTILTFDIKLEDPVADFYYDEATNELVINNLTNLYLVDGMHRIKAIYHCYDRNPQFNQPMELRIINYSDTEAKNLVFQEDHQNHMNKLTVKAYNMNQASNQIVERINNNPLCNLHNSINLNDGVLDSASLSQMIQFFWFGCLKTPSTNGEKVRITKLFVDGINTVTTVNPELLDRKWEFAEILGMAYVIYKHNKDGNAKDIATDFMYMYSAIEKKNDPKIKRAKQRGVYQVVLQLLDQIYEERG